MSGILFYHQRRRDGGLRTGVELEGGCVLERFEPGGEEFDSALEWWINVSFEGTNLPDSPEQVRRWLLQREGMVRRGLVEMAKDLAAGIDPTWPVQRGIPTDLSGVECSVGCSSIRLLTSQRIGEILSKLASRWAEAIQSLETVAEPVSH